MIKIKSIIILFIVSLNFGNIIRPIDNSTLNYTHVLFEWEQMENAKYYQLQLSSNDDFTNILTDTVTQSLIHIQKTSIDWNQEYYWRIQGLDENQNPISTWIDASMFYTGDKRSEAEALIYSQDIQDGVTIFSSFFDYFSAMIDHNGNEIWNTGDSNLVYYINNNYGQLYGTQFNSNEDELPGIKFSIDNEIQWANTGDYYVHHDFFQLPNGNYLGIAESYQNGPIPEDIAPDVLEQFQMIGYPTYPTSDFFIFPWVGDQIVEWDQDGNEVWSWNAFDYLDWLNDYDLLGDLWLEAYLMGRHDWTHSNAIWFEEDESAIYLSSRHLSRIIKIDYPSGNIVWQMGFNMPSGEVDCGHDLDFSFQHSLQILDNGNIVILDNGNNSQDIYGTDYPTTRAIEIAVNEIENGCQASIVWEYNLPEDLFGFASGNVQKLDNGNYLITTVGGGATSLEIKPTGSNSGDIVWQGNYNLTVPSGAVYRAHRIDGLYPVAFSITSDKYLIYNNQIVYPLNDGSNNINFKIWNNGETSETFNYSINSSSSGSSLQGAIEIDAGDYYNLTHVVNIDEEFLLSVIPEHRLDLAKSLTMTAMLESDLSNETALPINYKLDNPYPNPFNPLININFDIPKLSYVELKIYDIEGNLVEILENNYISSGRKSYEWNALNIASGTYIVSLKADNFIETKKIFLIK